jgi:hypothetical protein|uniref:Uncharacterized protein n=1 Tax=Picea glauca TaxID=3330 RepID=A0A101LYB5_PICGL|nr:hypothetical protein ABT39_MTgene5795 [Picea glauca]QHR90430.1 hypothetical protein Q903MT_gene4454 [Picea sitchensis]
MKGSETRKAAGYANLIYGFGYGKEYGSTGSNATPLLYMMLLHSIYSIHPNKDWSFDCPSVLPYGTVSPLRLLSTLLLKMSSPLFLRLSIWTFQAGELKNCSNII